MLRAFYLFLAVLMCIGLATLGLWPWVIKPYANTWINEHIQQIGLENGLILRSGEISVSGFNEIEVLSIRAQDTKKTWSIQAPLATVELSPIAIFFGSQPLRRIIIKQPQIFATITPSITLTKPSPSFKFEVPAGLRSVTIDDGFIQIEDPARRTAIQVSHFDIVIRKRFGKFKIAANTQDITIQHPSARIALDALYFKGQLVDEQNQKDLEIYDLSIDSSQGFLRANGNISIDAQYAFKDNSVLDYHLSANLRQILGPIFQGTLFDGKVYSQGRVGLREHGTQVWGHGSIASRNLEIDDVNLDLVDAQFKLDKNQIDLPKIEALFGGVIMDASAQIDPKNGWATKIFVQGHRMSLYAMLMDLGIKPSFVDMDTDIEINASGSLWPRFGLKGTFAGNASNLVVANRSARDLKDDDIIIRAQRPTSLRSEVEIDASAFRLQNLILDDGKTSAMVQCELNFKKELGLKLTVQSEHFDFVSINETIGTESYVGTGSFTAAMLGPYDAIRINGNMSLDKLVFENIDLGSISGRASYFKNDLNFEEVKGATRHANYQGKMLLQFLADTRIDLHLTQWTASLPDAFGMLDGSQYEKFATLAASHRLEGKVEGKLDLFGPIEKKNRNLQGALTLQFPNGLRVDNVLLDSFDFSASGTGSDWLINSARAKIGTGIATLNGTIRKSDLNSALSLKATQIPLTSFQKSFEVEGFTGELSTDITLLGKLDRLSPRGTVHLSDVQTSKWRFGNQELTFQQERDDFLTINGNLLSGGAKLSARLNLADDFAFKALVEWPFTSLSTYAKDLVLPFGTTLGFGGSIDLTGDLRTLKIKESNISLFPVSIQVFDRRWLSLGDLKIAWKAGSFHVEHFLFNTAQGDQVRVRGHFNNLDSQLDIVAAMDLEAVNWLRDDFETAQGRLNAHVQLSGDIASPNLNGAFDLHEGYFVHSLVPDPVDAVEASFELKGKEIKLKSFSGKSGSGSIEGSGRAELDDYSPSEIESHFVLKSFPFRAAQLLSGVVSGFLDFRQLGSDLLLTGDLKIREGYSASNFKVEDFKFQSKPGGFARTPIRLDVRVRNDDAIRIDSDLISGDLEGSLHIVGTHLKPGLLGSLELKSGSANFRNHNYQLRKARVDFDDAYRIVPRLDIVATGDIQDYSVQAVLQGTLDSPRFQLTSDPFLPESQLLILMSLGYTAQDIKKNFSTTAQTAGLEALSLYTGLGNNLTRFLNQHSSTRYFQIDELSLSSIYSKVDGVSLPAVRVGMNVWSGLRLKLQAAVAEDKNGKREQRIELEQNLGRRIKWRLGWDSDGLSNFGDAGLDLWYKWELD